MTPKLMSESRLTFFRQSGWLVIATGLGGVFMYAVHKVAATMPKEEYGVFTTLLQVINLIANAAIALQTTFSQQSAAAVDERGRRQLHSAVRALFIGGVAVAFLGALAMLFLRHELVAEWKISNPVIVWVPVVYCLLTIWYRVLMGVLQGRQDFQWFGNATIAEGIGRLATVTVIVLLLGGYAAGAMGATVLGLMVAFAIAGWRTRDVWSGESEPFDWRGWLKRVVPLMLGLGATTFMLSADMLVVQSLFPKEQTGYYAAAGMIGRALVIFAQPLTAVMFPKVVASAARSEKTNVLAQAIAATALLAGGGAVVCTLFPTLPLRLVYNQSYVDVAGPLVPWFAWCMLPLTLANVLVNNLLAKQVFSVVPWLVIIAAGYGTALVMFSTSFQAVIQIIGVFSVLLFSAAAWFTWRP